MLLAVDDTVFIVDAGDAADQGVADGPMLRLVPAPGGKFLAGLTAGGRLIVWLADFTKARSTLGDGTMSGAMLTIPDQLTAGDSHHLVCRTPS